MACSTETVFAPAAPTDARAIEALRGLVATPSVSGEERDAVRRFLETAQSLGFATEVDEAGNGIATRRAGATEREIVLLGHVDTVPGEIPVRTENGVLYGRGAVDAKGPLVAMLFGAARAEVPDGAGLRVVAAVGEETANSPGATYLRDRLRPDACIVGEPSGWDGVTIGYKGRLLVRATCERAGAHSAGPDGSASDALHEWWSDVLRRANEMSGDAGRAFDRVQASILSMRAESDGLSERAVLFCGFRLPPAVAPGAMAAAVREPTPEGITLTFDGATAAHATDRSDPVVRALGGAIRACGARPRPRLKTGTADLNVVGPAWGCPIAAYGPGDSSLDHTPNEHVRLDEFTRSIGVLSTAIGSLALELIPG